MERRLAELLFMFDVAQKCRTYIAYANPTFSEKNLCDSLLEYSSNNILVMARQDGSFSACFAAIRIIDERINLIENNSEGADIYKSDLNALVDLKKELIDLTNNKK